MNDAPAALRKFLPCLVAAVSTAFLIFSSGLNEPAMAQSSQKQMKKPASKGEKAKKKEAPPKEVRVWTFNRPNNVATLVFGVQNGDAIVTFSCQPETNLMRVVTHIGTRGVKAGDATPIRLSNGNVRVEFAGTAFPASTSGDSIDLGGATKIDPKFFGLFRAGDTLLLDIPGRKRGLPVKNSQQAADAFEKACGVK